MTIQFGHQRLVVDGSVYYVNVIGVEVMRDFYYIAYSFKRPRTVDFMSCLINDSTGNVWGLEID
jgi:hypothetical protein